MSFAFWYHLKCVAVLCECIRHASLIIQFFQDDIKFLYYSQVNSVKKINLIFSKKYIHKKKTNTDYMPPVLSCCLPPFCPCFTFSTSFCNPDNPVLLEGAVLF